MHATVVGAAAIGRAGVAVVANVRAAADACGTFVVACASAAIVTSLKIIDETATGCRFARIIGARIFVVADGGRALAQPHRAGVAARARVAVVASRGIERRNTAGAHIANVVGTKIVVVAICIDLAATATGTTKYFAVNALAGHARAAVGRATVIVIANLGRTRFAQAAGTNIADCAAAAIITTSRICSVLTPLDHIATVVCANIDIVAVHRAADASAVCAGVRIGARIVVAANAQDWIVLTAR